MRRILAAVAVGSVVFTTVLGSAANLTVGSRRLGAGASLVASCDTDGVRTTFATGFDTTQGYTVTGVTVSGINAAACAGTSIEVRLTDGSNVSVGAGGPVAVTGASVAIPIGGTIPATAVARTHVVIS